MSIELDKISNLHKTSYIFTFCDNSIYKNCFVKINGEYIDARHIMIKNYGESWGFQYTNIDEAGVLRLDLYQIDLEGRPV